MEAMNNLKINDKHFNPGSLIKEKTNDSEYILLGYDYTGTNMICIDKGNTLLNKNIRVFNMNDVDLIKENIIYQQTKYFFE